MPKIVDHKDQRRQIREAARKVFARRGIEGTGLAHVAEAAGMGRSSLYHYYPDKRALLRGLARDLLIEEEDLFRTAADADGDALERIERLATLIVAVFEEQAAVGRVLLQMWARDAARFRVLLERLRTLLAATISEGQAEGCINGSLDANLTGAIIIGMLDGLLIQYYFDPKAFHDHNALHAEVLSALRRLLAP
jgi:AcrR family transcriptional regulator